MASIEVPGGVKRLSADPVEENRKFDAIDEATAVANALIAIPLVLRFKGLSVLCNGVEYRFVNGILDSNLTQSIEVGTTTGASLVLGRERFNMEVNTISVTSNILKITFKDAYKTASVPTTIMLSSVSLGITNPQVYTIVPVVFPVIRNHRIVEVNLNTPLYPTGAVGISIADIAETSINDLKFPLFAEYMNESLVSFQQTGTVVTFIFSKNIIFPTISCDIHCPDLGAVGAVAYRSIPFTLVRVTDTTYTLSGVTSGTVPLTLANGQNCIFYVLSTTEQGEEGIVNVYKSMTRPTHTGSVGKNTTFKNHIDWKSGIQGVTGVVSELSFEDDETGEVSKNASPIGYNNFYSKVLQSSSRPRTRGSSNFSDFTATNSSLSTVDVSFLSQKIQRPIVWGVSVHSTVSSTALIATVNTTAAHGLKVGDTVIINSLLLSKVNDSVVVTSTPTTTSFTFSNTTIVASATDTNSYSYVTQARRATNTVSNPAGIVTIITTAAHGYTSGNTVFIHSTILGLTGSAVVLLTASGSSMTFTAPIGTNIVATATSNPTGYTNRSTIPHLLTTERDANNTVTLTLTSSLTELDTTLYPTTLAFEVGQCILFSNVPLGFPLNTVFIIQNIVGTTKLQFKNTGAVLAPSLSTSASFIKSSTILHTRAANKGADLRTHGWYIAGTLPNNDATDFYIFDRSRIGYYSDMGTTTNAWNFYVKLASGKNYLGRNTYFGNTITEVIAADINVISEGAMIFGNTTTGTPVDGTLSKITNGDANYFSNGNWRGLLHVLGGTGVNANIVTNTANALLKFVGTGLQAISSLITDNGTFLKYNTKTVQSTQSLSNVLGNSLAVKTLGHRFTIPANLTEVGSCIQFNAVFLKNVNSVVTIELAVISNATLDANNGTAVLTYLEAGGAGTLDSGDSYILNATLVRDTLASIKISATLLGGGVSNGDAITETRYINFTSNSTNTLDIGIRMTGSATNDIVNHFSTLKY